MSKYRKIAIIFLILYIGIILWITILSREPEHINYTRPLWKFYSYYWLYYGFTDIVPNLVLNIALFIPFGFLLSCSIGNDKVVTLFIVFLFGAALSCAIEFTQLYFSLGMFELDDIVNNTLGSVIGLLIFRFIKRKTACE